MPGLVIHARSVLPGLLLIVFLVGCSFDSPPHQRSLLATQGMLSAALSQSCDYVVIGSIHHGGSLWKTSGPERIFDWNHEKDEFSSFNAVAISEDDRSAATVNGRNIVVWSIARGNALAFWQAPDKVQAVRLSKTGRYGLLGLANGAMYFDLALGASRFQFEHDGPVTAVALSANYALTAGDDFHAKLWRLDDGALVRDFEFSNKVRVAAISDNEDRVYLSALREKGRIYRIADGKLLSEINHARKNIVSAQFSRNASTLSLGSFAGDVANYDAAGAKRLQSWSVDAGKFRWGTARSKAILSICEKADGHLLAISSGGELLVLRRQDD